MFIDAMCVSLREDNISKEYAVYSMLGIDL
jgi:hypothetical protein